MLLNHLKIALRNLWKNRLFTSINLLGMSIGMACVVVLVLFAQKCLTFDGFHAKSDRIFYIQTESNGQTHTNTVYPILGQLLKDYPEIETGTHIQSWYWPWMRYGAKDVQPRTKFVDSTFFEVFSFPLKYGNPATALKDRNSLVIDEKTALSLFGEGNPVGKTITLDDTLQMKVGGVLADIPANSSQQFEALLPTTLLHQLPSFKESADWYNTFANVFLVLKKGADKSALEAKLPQLVKTHFSPDAQKQILHVSPFANYIHDQNPTFKNLIYGAMGIAAFLLLIISINLINLTMASALPRAKEVAVRQVVGATKGMVLRLFWMESGIIMALSLLLAGGFAVYYLIPSFNDLRKQHMQLDISFANDYPTLLTVLGITLLVTLVAGTYPARYLMGLKTTEAVKGKISADPRQGRFRQNSLIVLQFVLAVVLIVETIGLRQQINFMKTTTIGFDRNNVLVFQTDLAYKNETTAVSEGRVILNELRQNPNVVSFTASDVVPMHYWQNFNSYYPEGNDAKKINLRHVSAGEGYFETYKIPFVEGRGFRDNSADSANHAVVINEAAMKIFGWTTAVGKRIRQNNNDAIYTVIGVTKNFHYQSLKDEVEPLLHWYGGKQQLSSFLTVRLTDESKGKALISQLETRFKKIPARRMLGHFYLNDEVNKVYEPIDNIWQMTSFVTLIAILTACAGIFGLISLVAKQRIKEIGIRKTLGASVGNITALLSSDFMKLVVIALCIALPISYWLGIKLLRSFAYRVEVQWWYLGLASFFALAIALLSVIFQAIRAAMANPVKSLKTE
jgi:putative ABC transport system permease protein